MKLEEVMTFTEANNFLGKNHNYLNDLAKAGRIIKGVDYREAGRVRLILKATVERLKEKG